MTDVYFDLSCDIPLLENVYNGICLDGKTYSLGTNIDIVSKLRQAEHSNNICLGLFLENYIISLLEKLWKYPELIIRKHKVSENTGVIDLYIEGRKLAFELKLGGSFYDTEKRSVLEKKVNSWKNYGLKSFVVMFLSTEDKMRKPYLSGPNFCKLVQLDYEKIMNVLFSTKTRNDTFRKTIYQKALDYL